MSYFSATASATVNVTAGLPFEPLSHTLTYNANKAALHSYTSSLCEQLKGKAWIFELAPIAV